MNREYRLYIIGLLLYGTNGVATHFIDLSSMETVYLRSMLGAGFMLAVYLLSGRRFTVFSYKKDLLYLALSGISAGVNWMLLFAAYSRIGVGVSLVIDYVGPAIVLLISPFVLKERLEKKKVIAVLGALFGVAFVGGGGITGGSAFGFILAALAACAFAGIVIFDKKATHVKGIENAVVQMVFTFLTIAAVMAFRGELTFSIPVTSLPGIAWLGIINTGVASCLYYAAVSRLRAQAVSVLGYIEPMSAVLFSAFLLGERMDAAQWVGTALILGSAVFSELHFPDSSHIRKGTGAMLWGFLRRKRTVV